jgi:hypothetical protein
MRCSVTIFSLIKRVYPYTLVATPLDNPPSLNPIFPLVEFDLSEPFTDTG